MKNKILSVENMSICYKMLAPKQAISHFSQKHKLLHISSITYINLAFSSPHYSTWHIVHVH
jgi:hypothetical protein